MDQKTLQYFKRGFSGKNRVARLLDSLLGCLFLFVLGFAIYWTAGVALNGALILAAATALAVKSVLYAVHRHRLEGYIERRIRQEGDTLVLERLMLMDRAHFRKAIKDIFSQCMDTPAEEFTDVHGGFLRTDGLFCYAFRNHPEHPVDVQQMTSLVRRANFLNAEAACLSAAPYTDDARALAARMHIELIDREELLAHAGALRPTREEILSSISSQAHLHTSRDSLKKRIFGPGKARAYATTAVLLGVWCLFFRFNILYPVVAGLSACMALYSYLSAHKVSA